MPDKKPNPYDISDNFPSTSLVHTPSTGFIDIKPVVEFSSSWKEPASLILFVLACVLFLYFVLPFLKKNTLNRITQVILPPYDLFKKRIQELQTQDLSIRQFSEDLSTTIRIFIDSTLFISTETRTPKEALRLFEPTLKERLPILPKNIRNEIENQLYHILTVLEEASYSDYAYRFNTNDWRSEVLSSAEQLIERLHTEIERERKRVQPVSNQTSQNTTSANKALRNSPLAGGKN